MKKSVRTAIAVIIIFLGLGLAGYPLVSNFLYEKNQKNLIKSYDTQMVEITEEKKAEELQNARVYNEALLSDNVFLTDPFEPSALSNVDEVDYNQQLNMNNDGIMGYLEIPALEVSVNIYHGTGSRSLEAGAGHLESTSLPVGGLSTHAVISAHTGLPGKKLFTDLELLETGDLFFVHVLDEILAYRVDQIKVVEPNNVSDLGIQRDSDFVTLVTCTPYGVNSHRLLVRGVRTDYDAGDELADGIVKKSGSQWMKQYFIGILIGIGGLIIVIIIYIVFCVRRNRRERKN